MVEDLDPRGRRGEVGSDKGEGTRSSSCERAMTVAAGMSSGQSISSCHRN